MSRWQEYGFPDKLAFADPIKCIEAINLAINERQEYPMDEEFIKKQYALKRFSSAGLFNNEIHGGFRHLKAIMTRPYEHFFPFSNSLLPGKEKIICEQSVRLNRSDFDIWNIVLNRQGYDPDDPAEKKLFNKYSKKYLVDLYAAINVYDCILKKGYKAALKNHSPYLSKAASDVAYTNADGSVTHFDRDRDGLVDRFNNTAKFYIETDASSFNEPSTHIEVKSDYYANFYYGASSSYCKANWGWFVDKYFNWGDEVTEEVTGSDVYYYNPDSAKVYIKGDYQRCKYERQVNIYSVFERDRLYGTIDNGNDLLKIINTLNTATEVQIYDTIENAPDGENVNPLLLISESHDIIHAAYMSVYKKSERAFSFLDPL